MMEVNEMGLFQRTPASSAEAAAADAKRVKQQKAAALEQRRAEHARRVEAAAAAVQEVDNLQAELTAAKTTETVKAILVGQAPPDLAPIKNRLDQAEAVRDACQKLVEQSADAVEDAEDALKEATEVHERAVCAAVSARMVPTIESLVPLDEELKQNGGRGFGFASLLEDVRNAAERHARPVDPADVDVDLYCFSANGNNMSHRKASLSAAISDVAAGSWSFVHRRDARKYAAQVEECRARQADRKIG